MKNSFGFAFLASSLLLVIASNGFAATTLTCTGKPGDIDSKNFESFELSIDAASASVSNVRFTADYIEGIKRSIESWKKYPSDATRRYIASAQALQKDIDRGTVAMSGKMIPYTTKQPKTPRVRYELEFASKAYDMSTVEFGPETRSTKLFVPLINGKPAYAQLYLEYDGSQGPYYDHFECK